MKHKVIFYFLGLLLILSCDMTMEYDFPEHEEVPVLNALFSADEGMKLSLTNSHLMNELNMEYTLLNADVFLLEDDQIVDTLTKDSTYYLSNHSLQEGSNYKITAIIPNYGELHADDYIPTKPVIKSMEIIDSVFVEPDGNTIFQLQLAFEDNPSSKDFYELTLYARFEMDEYGTITDNIWGANFATENDPIILNENLLAFDTNNIVFSDELFSENGEYMLNANFNPPSINDIFDFQLILIFRHVSYDYYMYKKQSIKHFANQESNFFEGIGQPVQMYSNIEGGLGIFAGFSQVMDSIKWEK